MVDLQGKRFRGRTQAHWEVARIVPEPRLRSQQSSLDGSLGLDPEGGVNVCYQSVPPSCRE